MLNFTKPCQKSSNKKQKKRPSFSVFVNKSPFGFKISSRVRPCSLENIFFSPRIHPGREGGDSSPSPDPKPAGAARINTPAAAYSSGEHSGYNLQVHTCRNQAERSVSRLSEHRCRSREGSPVQLIRPFRSKPALCFLAHILGFSSSLSPTKPISLLQTFHNSSIHHSGYILNATAAVVYFDSNQSSSEMHQKVQVDDGSLNF